MICWLHSFLPFLLLSFPLLKIEWGIFMHHYLIMDLHFKDTDKPKK